MPVTRPTRRGARVALLAAGLGLATLAGAPASASGAQSGPPPRPAVVDVVDDDADVAPVPDTAVTAIPAVTAVPAATAVSAAPSLEPYLGVAVDPADDSPDGATGALPVDAAPPVLNADPATPAPAAGPSAPAATAAPVVATGELRIPASVLPAYEQAARLTAISFPNCHLSWALLASIGRIESSHASGGRVDAHGTTLGVILGARLDGSPGYSAIADSDHGVLDGDTVWDRAVGPMQFLPSTWRGFAVDGNGDGVVSPNNVYDAAAAAGAYLCAGRGDLANPSALSAAVFRYNHSASYVATVVAWARAYATGVRPVPSLPGPIPVPLGRQGTPRPPAAPTPPVVARIASTVTALRPAATPPPAAPAPTTPPVTPRTTAAPPASTSATQAPPSPPAVTPTGAPPVPSPAPAPTPTSAPPSSTVPVPSPTPTPSLVPTPAPSVAPTPVPSVVPTPVPLPAPTPVPLPAPVPSPVSSPVSSPAQAAVAAPSPSPTPTPPA